MPEVLGFKGWRYNSEKVNINDVIAPPYDVVSEEEIKYYKSKSNYNIFHLELPESSYKARELLKKWMEEKVIFPENMRCIYLYELDFFYGNKKFCRRGFILLVKLSSFKEGKIIPHEKTYPKVTEERFELLKATGFQFSQIFGIYQDPELDTLKNLDEKELLYEVTFGSEVHRLYRITSLSIQQKISAFLYNKPIYIADGHHRYTTALRFKSYMEEKFGKNDQLDFNYICMYVCPMEEPGLLMLPTHRVYLFSETFKLIEKLKNFLEVEKISEEILKSDKNFFREKEREYLLVFNRNLLFCRIRDDFWEEIKKLDPVLSRIPLFNFLHIFYKATGLKEEELKEKGLVKFYSTEKEVLKKSEKGLGVIFPVISPLILKEVAGVGKLMPHKCTYFYPKILTCLLLREIKGEPVK